MCFLGTRSYGIYVFHGMIAYWMGEHRTLLDALGARIGSGAALVVGAGAGSGISLLVAATSYELFEKPFLRLKSRLAPSSKTSAPGGGLSGCSGGGVSTMRAAQPVLANIALLGVLVSCAPARRTPSAGSAALPETTPDAREEVVRPGPGGTSSLPPNPLVSRSKRVVGWSSLPYPALKNINDGDYSTAWGAGRPTPDQPAWVAIDVGAGPQRVLVNWSAGGSYNYEETDYGSPGAYRIETSSDSTDGANGSWRTAVDVPAVTTHGQAHVVEFAGQRWVKLVVTGTPDTSPNGVQISELDVHDVTGGGRSTRGSSPATASPRSHITAPPLISRASPRG